MKPNFSVAMDEKLDRTESSVDMVTRLDDVEKLVVLWDPSIYHLPLLRGHYFRTVDEVISLSISRRCGFPEHLQARAERVLGITMSRLEDKFCRLMMRNQFLTETERTHVLQQSESTYRSYRTDTIACDHYNNQTDIVSAISYSNSILTSKTSSDYNTRSSYSPISFSTYSAEHPDEYRSAFDFRLGSIFDATEIFMGDISDLKAIANRMIRANHLPELTRAFVTTCTEIVTNDFSLMGFRELTEDEAQSLSWDALSHEMKNWVRVAKVTFQVTLPRKRWLCDEVFGSEMASAAFDEAAERSVMHLMKFAKSASHRKGSAKIIFHLLSMYETLTDALAGARRLFAEAPEKSMCREIEGTVHDLGNAILHILPAWLEDLAQNGLSDTEEGKEGIDKFTKYAISYISILVVHHRHSLNLLLHDDEPVTGSDAMLRGLSETTPLGHKILTLISYLYSVLEHRSRSMEPGIREIFLMNNLYYVLDSVNNSELKMQLGADWSQELEERVLKLLARYLKSSWGDMLESLNDKSLRRRKGLMLLVSTYKTAYQQKIKRFNSAFEAACNLQSSWKVPDPQLRQEIRLAVSRTIIPAYNSFLEENHHFVSFGVELEMYTTEALEDRIFGLFEGC